MAGTVAVRFLVVFRSSLVVDEPSHGVVAVQVFWMRSEELQSLEPERGYAFWRVVKVDVEPVGLVMVLHVAEHIVINVAEKFNFGFDAPVVFCVCEGGVVVEHARIPAAHLMVRDHVGVLDVIFFEDLGRLLEQVH